MPRAIRSPRAGCTPTSHRSTRSRRCFDGVVLHGGGGQIRTDLDVKVWKFLSETDVPGLAASRQPDTDRFRLWEVAGTSHLDAQLSRGLGQVGLRAAGGAPVDGFPAGPTISGGGAGIGAFQTASNQPNDGCAKPIFSRVPSNYAQNAMYDHFARWIKDGTPPPTAKHIELTEIPAPPAARGAGADAAGGRAAGARGGDAAPAEGGRAARGGDATPARGRGGDAAEGAGRAARGGGRGDAPEAGARGGGRGAPAPPRFEIVRDDAGNALGGIRLSQHAVPTATNTGVNTGGMFCGLLGSSEPFDAARLARLYPTQAAYADKVKDVTEKNLKAGYIVKADAEATIAEARSSKIGKK